MSYQPGKFTTKRASASAVFAVAIAIAFLLGPAVLWAQAAPEAETRAAALVFVKGGTFMLGEWRIGFDVEGAHEVEVSSFYMASREVTVAEYAEFMDDIGGLTYIPRFLMEFGLKPQPGQVWNGKEYEVKSDATWRNPYIEQENDHPVVLVNWNDAAEYCNWLSLKEGLEEVYQADGKKSRYYIADFSRNGYRLPTEAEWEWAARGGIRSWGYDLSGSNTAADVAWLSKNSNQTTHPVGQKKPNELGIYDMSGNVFEWCNDWYGDYSPGGDAAGGDLADGPPVDPIGPDSGKSKVIRGGSWLSEELSALVMERSDSPPNCGFNDLGFRVVRASGPGTGKSLSVVTTTTTTTLPPKPFIPKGFVEMLPVEGGSFMMGSTTGPADASPVHKVTLTSFHIAKYEVTVNQFRKFAEVTGYKTDAEKSKGAYIYDSVKWVVEPDANWNNPHIPQTGADPVVHITWWDAINFCNALSDAEGLDRVYDIDGHAVSGDLWKNGYRLPTEAEWEYAARGGKYGRNTTYSGSEDPASVAWFKLHYTEGPRPVGTKAPNELGIYDMSGNVFEWCQDRYAPYKAEAQSDPCATSKEMKFVLRGGCWLAAKESCAVYWRLNDEPSNTDYTFGFRVVRRP
jgi:formylglycine-generating enzyme required for sulfatase activity